MIHGDGDRIRPHALGAALAAATGGELVTLEGSGHLPQARDPVKVNLLLRDFVCPPPPATRWTRARGRRKRALFISSPIGLGPRAARRRDRRRAAQAASRTSRSTGSRRPRHVGARGGRRADPSGERAPRERVRPHRVGVCASTTSTASRRGDGWTRSSSPTSCSSTTSSRDAPYDLWIGDEAWELDYFLHENPELKTAAYVWLTDFVGWLPMPDGGEREAFLTADYNAEMIEHIDRYPRLRDRALFVGDPDDVVDDAFGPDLPLDPRLDGAALLVPRLHHRLRPRRVRRPRAAACRARLSRRRGGLHRHGRWVRRRRRPPSARDRGVPGGESARPGAAHDRRRGSADRPGARCPSTRASRCVRTSTSSTGILRRAISPSSREG